MTIAVLATVLDRASPRAASGIVGALVVGGIGLFAAKKVQMTQMPELVALMHSLVGLAACLVGLRAVCRHQHRFRHPGREDHPRSSRSTSAS